MIFGRMMISSNSAKANLHKIDLWNIR